MPWSFQPALPQAISFGHSAQAHSCARLRRALSRSRRDWGPVASWDNGNSWPIGNWNPHGGGPDSSAQDDADAAPANDGRRPGVAVASGAVEVVLETEHASVCGREMSSNFWLPIPAMAALGIKLNSKGLYPCGNKNAQDMPCGSITINGGANITLGQINPANGQDACGVCNCSLAFFGVANGQSILGQCGKAGCTPGTKVSMAWSPHNGPPPPPTPRPPPPPPPTSPTPMYPKGGAPDRFGEGGASHGLGESNHVIMLHYDNIYTSSAGGQNLTWFTNASAHGQQAGLPTGATAHEYNLVWTRAKGSRSVPAGQVYTIMTVPSTGRAADDDRQAAVTPDSGSGSEVGALPCGLAAGHESEHEHDNRHLSYTGYGELRDHPRTAPGSAAAVAAAPSDGPPVKYLLKSADFGYSWSWTALSGPLQRLPSNSCPLAVDPTDAKVIYAAAAECLTSSTDGGETWSDCSTTVPKGPALSSIHIKDSQTMILLRMGAPPLRTKDGGTTWAPLQNYPNISSGGGVTQAGSLSWSGNTFVVHGRDPSGPSCGRVATYVFASTDDGDSWVDWTDGLVTMSPSSAVWWDKDFYLTSAGEGIMVKRNAEK